MVHERKKTRKNGLTASRQNRRRKTASRPAAIDALDAANGRCLTIGTLAELLVASGEFLPPEVAANTGMLIAVEVEQLQALLEILWKKLP